MFEQCRLSILLAFCTFIIQAHSSSHPLILTGLYTQTEYDHVTIQYHNGKLQEKYLAPGLAFTPMKLFGYTYRPKKVRSDTDCFDNIPAQTKDPTNYKVSICVTNYVRPEDIVDVINKTTFDYDTLTLKGQTTNAVKEVFSSYTLTDVEIYKANELNEDIKKKITEELEENFGAIGKKIQVLSVSIKKKEVEDKTAAAQLGKAALVAREARTAELTGQLNKAKFETEKIKKNGQAERAAIETSAQSREQLEKIQSVNRKQTLQNEQALKNSETRKAIATITKDLEKEIKERTAKLYEEFPNYARHERANAYNSALGKNSKYVLVDTMHEEMQKSLSGRVQSWLYGGDGKCEGNTCTSR